MNRYLYLFLIGSLVSLFALAQFGGVSARNVVDSASATPTPTPKPSPTPDDEDEVIKVETELVNLNVRVVDRSNRPINNLREADFSIFEDNVKQTIDFFSRSEVPTNYSMVIDNSYSLRPQINEVIEASKIIVGTNRTGDETSIIRFVSSEKIEIVQDFTGNKEDLDDALENLYVEGGRTAIIDAVYLAIQRISDYDKPTGKDDRHRKALILISDGDDVNSYYTQKQLFDMMRETDVQIYTVGFLKDLDTKGGFISKSIQSKARSFLQKLADDTGGKAYFPNEISELNTIARDIATEMRTQYSIGYIPTNDKNDGTFRNIKVVVADGPGNQKRIPVTRSGRTAGGEAPTLQKAN